MPYFIWFIYNPVYQQTISSFPCNIQSIPVYLYMVFNSNALETVYWKQSKAGCIYFDHHWCYYFFCYVFFLSFFWLIKFSLRTFKKWNPKYLNDPLPKSTTVGTCYPIATHTHIPKWIFIIIQNKQHNNHTIAFSNIQHWHFNILTIQNWAYGFDSKKYGGG